MKAWVVLSGYELDFSTVRGVFTTEEKADAFMTRKSKEEKPLPFWVEESKVIPDDFA